MIIVDTNVVSELMRPSPSVSVSNWLDTQDAARLYTTAITVAEILCGIERLPKGNRKALLHSRAIDVFDGFEANVLAFDVRAASRYAEVVVGRDLLGSPINGFDAQIASICRVHDATLATRNPKDFEHVGITLIDPWATP